MINPDTFANEAVAIREIYVDLELEMLEKIAKELRKGSELSLTDWKIQKLLKMSEFVANKEEIIVAAQKINVELGDTIESAFVKGVKVTDTIIPGAVKTPVIDFFNINVERVNALTKNSQLTNINALIEFYGSVGTNYQDAINKSIAGVITGNKTLVQSIKSVTKDLAKQGVGSVTYGNGRKVNIASYMEMVTRTNATKTALEATTLRSKEYGYELVIVTQYDGCSETCQPWQGRVYFDDTLGDINNTKYPSLSTAINSGLFHPNCKHSKLPFDPDVQDKPETIKKDEELYDNRQEQRYNERNIRKWKKQNAVATGQDKLKTTAKVKEWQLKNRELIKKDSRLRRDYARESIIDNSKAISIDKVQTSIKKDNTSIKFMSKKDAINGLSEKGIKLDMESLDLIDDDLFLDNSSNINRLIDKYPKSGVYIEEQGMKYNAHKMSGNTMAACGVNLDQTNLTVTLNRVNYKDLKTTVSATEKNISSGYNMKASKEYLSSYNSTHEFGHLIHNNLMNDYIKANPTEWLEVRSKALKAKSINASLKKVETYFNKNVLKPANTRIIEIAKEMDSNLILSEQISRYGRTNNFEFFAECFANAESGAPNTLGKAMLKYLDEVYK